jgi:hypothetical protein
MRTAALVVLTLVGTVEAAPCQTTPGPVARFDLAASLGSSSTDHGELSDYSNWTTGLLTAVNAGYYWTDHNKSEVEAGWIGKNTEDVYERLDNADGRFGYAYSTHTFETFRVTIAQTYQFGRNAWVHPFVGAGLDIDRDTHTTDREAQTVTTYSGSSGRASSLRVAARHDVETTVRSLPFAKAGFKAYTSERVFFATDLKFDVGSGVERVVWKAALGIDF